MKIDELIDDVKGLREIEFEKQEEDFKLSYDSVEELDFLQHRLEDIQE